MAFSYSFNRLFLLVLAASLITIASADQALINSICSTNTLCHQIFNNSESVNADRAGLGKIATDAALQKIYKSLNIIRKLDHDTADNKTKNQYDTCLEMYDQTLSSLKECKLYFAAHDFSNASVAASGAGTGVSVCLEEITNAPPELVAAIDEFQHYFCILLAISHVSGNT